MSAIGRNQPCRCGSNKKTKHCCGVPHGPSESELAKAFLAGQARDAARRLIRLSEDELHDLFEEMLDLPEEHLSLQLPLPKLLAPELEPAPATSAPGPVCGPLVKESLCRRWRPPQRHTSGLLRRRLVRRCRRFFAGVAENFAGDVAPGSELAGVVHSGCDPCPRWSRPVGVGRLATFNKTRSRSKSHGWTAASYSQNNTEPFNSGMVGQGFVTLLKTKDARSIAGA